MSEVRPAIRSQSTPPEVARTAARLQTEAKKKGASPAEAVALAQKQAAEVHHDAPAATED